MVYLFLVAQVLEANNVCWFSFCLDKFDKPTNYVGFFFACTDLINQQLVLVLFFNEQVMKTDNVCWFYFFIKMMYK